MVNTDIRNYLKDNSHLINRKDGLKNFWDLIGASRIKSVQNHEEIRILLRFLRTVAKTINSYLEIGCSSGGTFYIIDSFLRIHNPNYKKGVAVDIVDKIRDFERYKYKYKTVEYITGNSRKIKYKENYFDLIFIDANHTYHGVKRDFNRYKNMCKMLILHDIAFYGNTKRGIDERGLPLNFCGVPKLWYEVKNSVACDYKEIIDFDGAHGPLGLGILFLE